MKTRGEKEIYMNAVTNEPLLDGNKHGQTSIGLQRGKERKM